MKLLTSAAQQLRLLLVEAVKFHKPASVSAVCSQFASYRVSSSLLSPGDRSSSSAAKKRPRNNKPVEGDGQREKKKKKSSDQSRVSSELRKLSLDDSPAERRKLLLQTSTPDELEVVFGVAPCFLALTQGRRKIQKLFVKDGESGHRASVLKVCEEAFRRGVRIQRVDRKQLDQMTSGQVHQGVCLEASRLTYVRENGDAASRRGHAPVWLVLEGIQDPMNLGAILRSAYFLGVDRVASSVRSSCPLTPVVSKASSGAMEVMEVFGYEKLGDMLRRRASEGWEVVGTVGAGTDSQLPMTSCSDFHVTKPTLLLLGSEGEGLSDELTSLCQTLITVPPGRRLSPGIESLNVSVAAGILLQSLLSSRTPRPSKSKDSGCDVKVTTSHQT